MSFELFHLIEQVLHNMAIAEYFKTGCSNSKKLLEDLNTVKVFCLNFNLGLSQCYVHLHFITLVVFTFMYMFSSSLPF